jgi:hypothetical protein
MGATERWCFFNDDGSVTLHVENDGWRFLKRGAEAVETVMTLDELKERYPGQHQKLLEAKAKGVNCT